MIIWGLISEDWGKWLRIEAMPTKISSQIFLPLNNFGNEYELMLRNTGRGNRQLNCHVWWNAICNFLLTFPTESNGNKFEVFRSQVNFIDGTVEVLYMNTIYISIPFVRNFCYEYLFKLKYLSSEFELYNHIKGDY